MTTAHDEHIADDAPAPTGINYHHPRYGRGGYWGSASAADLDKVPAPAPATVPALTLLSEGTAWLCERASDVLPTIAADDLAAAVEYVQAMLSHDPANGRADLLEMLRSRFVAIADAPTLPIVERIIGDELAGQSWQAAPRLFTTTDGTQHVPDHTGKLHSYRKALTVVGRNDHGEYVAGDGHDLRRQADMYLLTASTERAADGRRILGSLALIGGQDMAPVQQVNYAPDPLTFVRGKSGDVIGMWNEYRDKVWGRHSRPASGVVGGRADLRANGGMRHSLWTGASEPTDKPRYAACRAVAIREGHKHVRSIAGGTIVGPVRKVLDLRWQGTTVDVVGTVERLVTYWRGGKFTGIGKWEAGKQARNAARKAGKRGRIAGTAAPEVVDLDALASEVMALALKLSESPAPRPTFVVATPDGMRVHVALVKGKGYRMTISEPDLPKYKVTRSAPRFLASTLRNRIAKTARSAA